MQSVLIVLHIFGFLGLVITLWVSGPRISAYDALLNFENEGGWASMGVAVMVGQISAVQALACGCEPCDTLLLLTCLQLLMRQPTWLKSLRMLERLFLEQ